MCIYFLNLLILQFFFNIFFFKSYIIEENRSTPRATFRLAFVFRRATGRIATISLFTNRSSWLASNLFRTCSTNRSQVAYFLLTGNLMTTSTPTTTAGGWTTFRTRFWTTTFRRTFGFPFGAAGRTTNRRAAALWATSYRAAREMDTRIRDVALQSKRK